MKKYYLTFIIIAIGFMFQNCSTQKLNPEDYQRQWMLVSFKNFERDFLVKNKAQLDLSSTKTNPDQYSIFMGCNNMFVKAEFKSNGTVKFSDVGSTMMYCEDNMKLEDEFGKTLPTMIKFKIEGHQLTLSDGKGNEMKFIASDWD